MSLDPDNGFWFFVQSISGVVSKFKWCSFLASILRFCGWGGGAIAPPFFIKLSKISVLAVQYF